MDKWNCFYREAILEAKLGLVTCLESDRYSVSCNLYPLGAGTTHRSFKYKKVGISPKVQLIHIKRKRIKSVCSKYLFMLPSPV